MLLYAQIVWNFPATARHRNLISRIKMACRWIKKPCTVRFGWPVLSIQRIPARAPCLTADSLNWIRIFEKESSSDSFRWCCLRPTKANPSERISLDTTWPPLDGVLSAEHRNRLATSSIDGSRLFRPKWMAAWRLDSFWSILKALFAGRTTADHRRRCNGYLRISERYCAAAPSSASFSSCDALCSRYSVCFSRQCPRFLPARVARNQRA